LNVTTAVIMVPLSTMISQYTAFRIDVRCGQVKGCPCDAAGPAHGRQLPTCRVAQLGRLGPIRDVLRRVSVLMIREGRRPDRTVVLRTRKAYVPHCNLCSSQVTGRICSACGIRRYSRINSCSTRGLKRSSQRCRPTGRKLCQLGRQKLHKTEPHSKGLRASLGSSKVRLNGSDIAMSTICCYFLVIFYRKSKAR
jgi:hypothetical protein